MSPQEFSHPVGEHVRHGRLWRAREILAGRLRQSGFHEGYCRQLGVVLLRMGDLPAAGMHLFFVGAATREEEAAIAVFLDRTKRQPGDLFVKQLPPWLRHAKVEQLSRSVQVAWKRRVDEWQPRQPAPPPAVPRRPLRIVEAARRIGCFLVAALALWAFAVGAREVLQRIVGWFD